MKTRPYRVLFVLSILVALSVPYIFYVGTGLKADIFLFYDYPGQGRLISNILKDLSNMLTITGLLYLWYATTSTKRLQSIILPFLVVSLLDLIDYLLFFKQFMSVKLVVLVVLIFKYNLNTKNI